VKMQRVIASKLQTPRILLFTHLLQYLST